MSDQDIISVAINSPVYHYEWEGRGRAHAGYIKGMALTYARVYSKFKTEDKFTLEMAKANTHDASKDALAWYAGIFDVMKMDNSKPGIDTLRHTWTLLLGLGMRESSGEYCTGRDRTADNVTSSTAEAGLFQVSWNSHSANILLPELMDSYKRSPSGLVSVFKEGVTCGSGDWENYGSGPGVVFQGLCKNDPAFAAEYAAVLLRNLRAHWGPINQRAAEVRHDVDIMYQNIQKIVDDGNQNTTPLSS